MPSGGARPVAITIYGVCAVSFMMVMYALESRSRHFIAAFAVGCAPLLELRLPGGYVAVRGGRRGVDLRCPAPLLVDPRALGSTGTISSPGANRVSGRPLGQRLRGDQRRPGAFEGSGRSPGRHTSPAQPRLSGPSAAFAAFGRPILELFGCRDVSGRGGAAGSPRNCTRFHLGTHKPGGPELGAPPVPRDA